MFEYADGGTPMSYTLSQSKYVQPCADGRCVASCSGRLFASGGGNVGFESDGAS
jgi:rhodanese-related sulfurtransferase